MSVSGRYNLLVEYRSSAKSLVLECLTEAGKSLMNARKSSCPQWHFLPECQKRPDVILVKSVMSDTIMLSFMLQ